MHMHFVHLCWYSVSFAHSKHKLCDVLKAQLSVHASLNPFAWCSHYWIISVPKILIDRPLCIPYVFPVHTYPMYTVCISYLYHVYIICIPCVYHMYTVCISYVYHVNIVCIPCVYHVYKPFVYHVCIPCVYPVYTMCIPCVYCVYIVKYTTSYVHNQDQW